MVQINLKNTLKKVWYFLWEDDSIWSWIANVILAFVIIKFILYPGLGLLVGTPFPIVAVVSSSMEHDESSFNAWWEAKQNWYEQKNITQEDFSTFTFKNGFDKGEIVFIRGKKLQNIKIGDVLVFQSDIRSDPIIHRVVQIQDDEGQRTFTTKGDHNGSIYDFEKNIREDQIIGTAVFRIPYLGYLKLGFVWLLNIIGLG